MSKNKQQVILSNGLTFESTVEFCRACGYKNPATIHNMRARGYTNDDIARKRGLLK